MCEFQFISSEFRRGEKKIVVILQSIFLIDLLSSKGEIFLFLQSSTCNSSIVFFFNFNETHEIYGERESDCKLAV